jgi:hypothetical protein
MKRRSPSWHYHSEAPKKPRKASAIAGPEVPVEPIPLALNADPEKNFQISFKTHSLRPNHVVTLRTSIDGWERDIHGAYWYGAWRFVLPNLDYQHGCEFKFMLDGSKWQLGWNLTISGPYEVEFDDNQVKFADPAPRYLHGYENLRVSEDCQQQSLVRSSYAENTLWDVIVIGSGMGGGVLADALSDHNGKKIKVLVLDAGSFDYPTHVDNLPVTGFARAAARNSEHEVRHYDNDGSSSTHFGRSVQMNLGGRSVFWSGLIPRMQGWELAHWPPAVSAYLSSTGYDQAEKVMRKHSTFGKFQEDLIKAMKPQFPDWTIVNTPRSSHQPDFGPEGSPEAHPDSFRYSSSGTFSSAELLLDSLASPVDPGRNRLFINLNHLVTRLEHTGSLVTGVVCQDLVGNRQRTYRGKVVVLAAGSLESTKIALQSALADPDGKIGVGLTDHPAYYAPDYGGDTFYLKASSPYAGKEKHARIFFYPNQPYQGYWFNIEVVLNGQFWRMRHADDDVLIASHPTDSRTTVNFKFVFGTPLHEGNWVRLGGPEGRLSVRHLANMTGQMARPAVINVLSQLLNFFQVEPVDLSKEPNCHFGNGGTVNHAGGTMRMGLPNQPRVVDENLKFLSYDNLYVCDPSVYPFIPAANPSLTLVALSLRLADHLASKL